jgi:conjugative transfer pilus assembly protein TraH
MMCKVSFSKLILLVVTYCCLIINISIYAGIDSDLKLFFDSLGFDNNISAPSAYKGQEAGYYTGGSIFARTQVRDLQIAQIDLPGYRSGCGGIDIFAGGFSFINSDQLVAVFKNILNNAKGYAFTLAMETATPQIANVMKYLNAAAAEINKMNVNSCEAGVGLVGSLWPRTQEAQRRVCEDIGAKSGIFTDYAAAKHGCGSGGKLTTTLNKGSGVYKNMVFKEGNIAWKAIQQNGFLRSDTALAELFMSLSGSIIVRPNGGDDDAAASFICIPSLAANKDLLRALLHGGTATIYKCDETDNCLSPLINKITIAEEKSLGFQVKKILHDIAQKIQDNTAITKTEIGLLQATGLPVYKMLNLQSAFYKDQMILDVSHYSEIIAIDILFQYLSENLSIVRTSSSNLQYPEEIMHKFTVGIDAARTAIRAEQKSAYAEITTTTQLIQQTQLIEQMLAGYLSSQMTQTMKWAKGDR